MIKIIKEWTLQKGTEGVNNNKLEAKVGILIRCRLGRKFWHFGGPCSLTLLKVLVGTLNLIF